MTPATTQEQPTAAESIMGLIRKAIETNTKIYRGTNPSIDTTSAVIAILKIYEGDRYEDVMRGGQSVARAATPPVQTPAAVKAARITKWLFEYSHQLAEDDHDQESAVLLEAAQMLEALTTPPVQAPATGVEDAREIAHRLVNSCIGDHSGNHHDECELGTARITQALDAARKDEREQIAKMADAWYGQPWKLAIAIRARQP